MIIAISVYKRTSTTSNVNTNQEKEQLAGYVKGDVLTDLLPVLDNFERAVQSPAEGDAKVFLDGFIMIHQNLMAMLSKHGLAVIDAVG